MTFFVVVLPSEEILKLKPHYVRDSFKTFVVEIDGERFASPSLRLGRNIGFYSRLKKDSLKTLALRVRIVSRHYSKKE